MVKAASSAAVPVHDVGGESGGEAEHVEADFRRCAEPQASHDREQGEVYPQPCRLEDKQCAQWNESPTLLLKKKNIRPDFPEAIILV